MHNYKFKSTSIFERLQAVFKKNSPQSLSAIRGTGETECNEFRYPYPKAVRRLVNECLRSRACVPLRLLRTTAVCLKTALQLLKIVFNSIFGK